MSSKAVMSIQHLSLLIHLPSPQSTWELVILTYFTSFPLLSTIPVRVLLSEAAAKQRTESRNFSPRAWTEIYKNLNQHHTIYAEAFIQHSPLCYLPGLLEWMANMVENTLLSWCFAFCKRSSFVSPTLVLNWTPSTKVSVQKVTSCSTIALKKMLLCYFIFSRKFLVFTQ